MAQNITLMGATYNAVPAVQLPKQGGGTAQFDDTTDANATADDIMSGKTAYVNGTKITGTATGGGSVTQDANGYIVLPDTGGGGGGGGSSYTLLGSDEMTINSTSTSAVSEGYITVNGIFALAESKTVMIFIKIRDKAGKRSGYFYGTDNIYMTSSSKLVMSYRDNAGTMTLTNNTFGVYVDSISGGDCVNIYSRYNSSLSYTIDGTYSIEVYSLEWPDNQCPLATP